MSSKPTLLIIELWGLGDLAIASRFIKEASLAYEVTLLAKPYARDLQLKLWPGVSVVDFIAPWTAFQGKYRLHRWPYKLILETLRSLRAKDFEFAVSGRWDPRDHAWMKLTKARKRIGFPRLGSGFFLSNPLSLPHSMAHRYEQWRLVGEALKVKLPSYDPHEQKPPGFLKPERMIVHTGAAQALRVWPLERFDRLLKSLEDEGQKTTLICDANQEKWWKNKGRNPVVPRSVAELIEVISSGHAFIGNDSGPGHLAAALEKPTLTIFGPQLTEWFRPVHDLGMVVEGKQCPYKPCFDQCQFDVPRCLTEVSYEEVKEQSRLFLKQITKPNS
ncbi:MAG: glycosyltransferase family 9 protein [Verrucomicrobiota bacterium]|nr:glycosyltransferase family 9 protein [Verrucomicrobiota bacterium]